MTLAPDGKVAMPSALANIGVLPGVGIAGEYGLATDLPQMTQGRQGEPLAPYKSFPQPAQPAPRGGVAVFAGLANGERRSCAANALHWKVPIQLVPSRSSACDGSGDSVSTANPKAAEVDTANGRSRGRITLLASLGLTAEGARRSKQDSASKKETGNVRPPGVHRQL
jgi:hypothetical protein